MKTLLVVGILCLAAITGFKAGESLTRWEYLLQTNVNLINKRGMATLDSLGAEGWEAVNMVQNADLSYSYLLKRPLQ